VGRAFIFCSLSHNEVYVKYDSNTDLKQNPSKQKKQKRKVPNQEKEEEMQRNADSGDPVEPNPERQELIDKGHVKPDPDRDLMSHEEWHEQDTFLGKTKQSWRRTFDDFRGRTKDLEEKAHGKERGKESVRAEPKAEQAKPTQQRDADKNKIRSAQQEKWRSEMSRNREAGRDDPEQGRE
jgi:hypothetical protein